MKKVAFYTLGCKVNQYETEAVTGIFEKNGYTVVEFDHKADVYVINTCTVTNMSDRKSRQIIRRAKSSNPDSIVVVMGCYAQTASEEVSHIPGVNLVMGTKDRNQILEHIQQLEGSREKKLNVVGNIMTVREFEEMDLSTYKERTRAFLKIQEGCSQYCAYCIIPYARGPIRSRKPEDVLKEVERLAEAGFLEIVLTGIHIASYGRDLGDIDLVAILQKIHEIEGIRRIRIGSIEPNTITPRFLEAVASLDKLCPHFHISLQSGCDATLRRMNRKYTAEEYKNGVKMLREICPEVAITTDVMVGFPGETEEEFEQTVEFLKEIDFAQMHVFKYSPRKGTPAAQYKDQVAPEEKERRSSILVSMAKENILRFNRRYLGNIMTVLIEQPIKGMEGYVEGLTTNYIRVVLPGEASLQGQLVHVKMEKAEEEYVIGSIVE